MHRFTGLVGIAVVGMLTVACGGTPTAPSRAVPANTTVYRGTLVASPALLASGLRIVAGDGGSVTVSVSGQFEITLNDSSVRLRLVGGGFDLPIDLRATAVADIVELRLHLDGGLLFVVSSCYISVSTSGGARIELRTCVP